MADARHAQTTKIGGGADYAKSPSGLNYSDRIMVKASKSRLMMSTLTAALCLLCGCGKTKLT
jgi:hypothetical protein